MGLSVKVSPYTEATYTVFTQWHIIHLSHVHNCASAWCLNSTAHHCIQAQLIYIAVSAWPGRIIFGSAEPLCGVCVC